jgi:nucleoside 2-deoxyribosyltransferase
MPVSPAVYLAGPDVFRPDATARYEHLERCCASLGLVGLRPSDGGLSTTANPGNGVHAAQRIYEGNVALIRQCDAVLANLAPFRGHIEPDSGTVFEIGMAVALGKPVAAYLPEPSISYAERVRRRFPTRRDPSGALWDLAHGVLVEGFGEPVNLMLSRSTRLFATFEEALAHLADALRDRQDPPGA